MRGSSTVYVAVTLNIVEGLQAASLPLLGALGFPEDDPAHYASRPHGLLNDISPGAADSNRLEVIIWKLATQKRLNLLLALATKRPACACLQ
jgi:hypothetical protein